MISKEIMEKVKEKHNFNVTELSDAEFLSYLYAERDREESLNSYQGWNSWAVVGALITVACAAYGIISRYITDLDKLRTLYLVSKYLGTIFGFWYAGLFYMSSLERKRAKDYKRIKRLKDITPIPYLIVVTVCSVYLALSFLIVPCDNRWNGVTISWIVLAFCYLLISFNVYMNRNTIVWAVKDNVWFSRTRQMLVAGTSVYVMFWMIWKWSLENISGPFLGTPEFELAVCITAIVMLIYLYLKIKLKNRKSSEIDVLIDEYLYKGKSKEEVYGQLRTNLLGRDMLETCSKEFLALKKYYDDFDSQKKKLKDLKVAFSNGTAEACSLEGQLDSLRESLEYSGKWAKKLDALHDRLEEIAKNVPELKEEEEFRNMQAIVGMMLSKTGVINNDIKMVTDDMEKFMEKHICLDCGCCKRKPM